MGEGKVYSGILIRKHQFKGAVRIHCHLSVSVLNKNAEITDDMLNTNIVRIVSKMLLS